MTDYLKSIGFYTLSDDRTRNTSERSQMKRAELIITEYCNFTCAYCRPIQASAFGDRKIKQMSLDEIKTTIDYWRAGQPLENIRFSGGEPTLHHSIKDAVAYAKAKGIKRIAISTNGSNKLYLYKELVDLGTNDFSVSLDGCCAEDVNAMAGGVKGAFEAITSNIEALSKLAYLTVGIVLTPENVAGAIGTIRLADKLDVSDIRVIPSAQYNKPIEALGQLEEEILARHPILRYRVERFKKGEHVRGMKAADSPRCAIVLDDSIVAGGHHYPCVISFREHGAPIGKVGPNMRAERAAWFREHNCLEDPICKANCLDCIVWANNKFREFHPELFTDLPTKKHHLKVI